MTAIPYGRCHCGCGELTPIARNNDRRIDQRKGEPRRYLTGHHRRQVADQYLVEDLGHATPCWTWQFSKTPNGYGQITRAGKRTVAHRWFYEQRFGAIPDGLVLDHLCRNRACVNPEHVEPVTRAENARRGNKTRLTAEDVRAIRASTEPRSVLAERYGVLPSSIGNIQHRRRAWVDA